MKVFNYIIDERITIEIIKELFRKYNILLKGNKEELLIRLKDSVSEEKIPRDVFDRFIINLFKYGKNNIIMSNIIGISPTSPLTSYQRTIDKLGTDGKISDNFNSFFELAYESVFENPELVYQEIDDSTGNVCIEQCYAQTQISILDDGLGEQVTIKHFNFTWVSLNAGSSKITIHTNSNALNHFEQESTLKKTNEFYVSTLKDIFSFEIASCHNQERTLYNIYKNLTDKSEEQFRENVTQFSEKIKDFYNEISTDIGYNVLQNQIKLDQRIESLLIRGLVSQQFDLYEQYFEGKLGLVRRIVFYDTTGANVSATVKEIDKNITTYEIYFDTKETLDQKKSLNKLWVNWFIKFEDAPKFDSFVKFEIKPNYYITHFLYSHLTEEVAAYVLSKFEEFEN